jgi:hypothetical protein
MGNPTAAQSVSQEYLEYYRIIQISKYSQDSLEKVLRCNRITVY